MLSPKDSCREGHEGSHCGLESRDSAWKRIHETRRLKKPSSLPQAPQARSCGKCKRDFKATIGMWIAPLT